MTYTTSQLDAVIAQLESSMGKGFAQVTHDGHTLVYKSNADIRGAIAYFKALYDNATDAPASTPKVRTLYGYTNNGFNF